MLHIGQSFIKEGGALFFKRITKLKSVADGLVLPITEVPDKVFSEKMLGDGFAVKEHNGNVFAPVKGEVVDIHSSKHSITIKTPNGELVLIHMGIDTVELRGEGFSLHTKIGDHVKQGDLLAIINLDILEQHKMNSMVIVVLPENKVTFQAQPGPISLQNTVLTIDR